MKPKIYQTGKLPLTLGPLAAILSLSLVVNLPGLAVTPMLGTLAKVFPDTTEFEQQLLTTLPNLLIIPFVLMAGKLSESSHKITLVTAALVLFAFSSVAYLFSQSMLALILFSCSLGIGAGLIIPFSTGLLSDTFSGKHLMKMMGLQSGISNLTLVCATFVVGWLSLGNWHMPFAVYLVCLIPLFLTVYLKKIPKSEINPEMADKLHAAAQKTAAVNQPAFKCGPSGMSFSRISQVFLAYFGLTVSTITISLYMPYLLETHHFEASIAGTMTSLFFLCVFTPGFLLPRIVKLLGKKTFVTSGLFVLAGMSMITFIPSVWVMGAGVMIAGFGYGVLQPLFYDKATKTVCRPSLGTKALSIVLVANYSAIVIAPVYTSALAKLFGSSPEGQFPFVLSVIFAVALFVSVIAGKKSFCFTVDKEYLT